VQIIVVNPLYTLPTGFIFSERERERERESLPPWAPQSSGAVGMKRLPDMGRFADQITYVVYGINTVTNP
jgi:hypothetical protein